MGDAFETVLAGAAAIRGWQENLYRDLHQHPELSHQEHRTARLVADRLRQAELEVHEGVGGTGVIGRLNNGDGPTVLVRADRTRCRFARTPVSPMQAPTAMPT